MQNIGWNAQLQILLFVQGIYDFCGRNAISAGKHRIRLRSDGILHIMLLSPEIILAAQNFSMLNDKVK